VGDSGMLLLVGSTLGVSFAVQGSKVLTTGAKLCIRWEFAVVDDRLESCFFMRFLGLGLWQQHFV